MKKYILTTFCGCCLFLTGCQLGTRVISPGNIKNIVIQNISESSQILSCVAETETLTPQQLHEKFVRANEAFMISGNDTDLFQLICFCIVWPGPDSPVTLNLGTSLLNEYINTNESAGEDMQGFYRLLTSFKQRLHKKEIKLKNAADITHDMKRKNNALAKKTTALENQNSALENQNSALESQLQKLKNIEKILNERSN